MQIEVTTHEGTKIVNVTEYLTRDKDGFYHNVEDTTMTQQYEIIDYGFMYSDYFQGIGTAGTEFDEATYGIGSTRHEAYNDAVELIYQRLGSVADKLGLPKASEVGPDAEMDEDAGEGCYWHVGIRFNVPKLEQYLDVQTDQIWIFETRNGINFLVPQGWPNNATEICEEDDPQAFTDFLETLEPLAN